MFFAGYETTSSAVAFCCHVLAQLPDEKDKLLDEIHEFEQDLGKLVGTSVKQPSTIDEEDAAAAATTTSSSRSDSSLLDDDVFDNDHVEECSKHKSQAKTRDQDLSSLHDLYETIERMKYLDMFVREVLRMFPIANSMVSRKCAVQELRVDNGNYAIPYGMNVVVDVLTIHYDAVLWGPVDPHKFHPERFLAERHPAAWLPFGESSF
jgi:cytochrome P450